MRRCRHAFSLVELLVVVAIIGILISIAVPVMAHARAAAHRAQCSSNLRQIGVAFTIYDQQDFPGNLPPAVSFPQPLAATPPGQVTIMGCLDSYLDNNLVWRCPSDDLNDFALYGSSYEYTLAILQSFPNYAQLEAMAFDLSTVVPAVQDADSFHAEVAGGNGTQAVYMDGHVGWLVAP